MSDRHLVRVEVNPLSKKEDTLTPDRATRHGGLKNLPPALAHGLVIHSAALRSWSGSDYRPVDPNFIADLDSQVEGSGQYYQQQTRLVGEHIAASMSEVIPKDHVAVRMNEVAFQASPRQLRHVKAAYESGNMDLFAIQNGYAGVDTMVADLLHNPDFKVTLSGQDYSRDQLVAASRIHPQNPLFGFFGGIYSYSTFTLDPNVTRETFLSRYHEVAALVTSRLDGWALSAPKDSEAAKLLVPFRESTKGGSFGRNALFDFRQNPDVLKLWQTVGQLMASGEISSTVFELKTLTKAFQDDGDGRFFPSEFKPDLVSHGYLQDILHGSMARQLWMQKIAGLSSLSDRQLIYQPGISDPDQTQFNPQLLSLTTLSDPGQLPANSYEQQMALMVWDQVLLNTDHYLVKVFYPVVGLNRKTDPRLIMDTSPQFSQIKINSVQLVQQSKKFTDYLVRQLDRRYPRN